MMRKSEMASVSEYEKHLNGVDEARQEIADILSVDISSPGYFQKLDELKARRAAEKKLLPNYTQDPDKEYRWCDPRSERFPYVVAKGFAPVVHDKRLIYDNERILCARDKEKAASAVEVIERLTYQGE
jgi:hypothetical protein